MTDDAALDFHAVSERQRLAECSVEAIRTPGRIQSHGILLGVDAVSGTVTVASENAGSLLGRHVADLGSQTLEWAVAAGAHIDPVRVELAGEPYDAIAHQLGDRAVIELEPAVTSLDYARLSVVGAIQQLSQLSDVDAIRRRTVEMVREITGYDRVMMYHFYDDGHGEVVAEARADDMESFAGLHFPASDIPVQARELYLTKLSRAIVSTDDPGTPLLALEGDASSLDLSQAELRAVSPHHLQYMRNMGQATTVSLSMISDGRLIGMITCAHRTERRMPILLRRALEVLAGQITLQIVALESIERLSRTLRVRERRAALLAPLMASGDVLATLLDGRGTVRDLIPSEGVIARVDGMVRVAGDVPGGDRDALVDAVGDDAVATDALAADRPDLARLMPGFAGLLVVPLGGDDRLLFLRREAAQVVRWLGDLGEDNRADPLSPRNSFSEWQQSVSGRSLPWGDAASDATELGRELRDVLARRADAELAGLALLDPLTGLHNRRYLTEQLQLAVADDARAALLFVDLDRFKSINDSHGHEFGDIVLTAVAQRLRESSRPDDVVARLGGDEFVLLCRGVGVAEATRIAERLLAAVARPVETPGRPTVTITGSFGIAPLDHDRSPAENLDRADAAMYRAKGAGRNRSAE
ncbi:diguanylate cyclase domain-containing protein [Pseudolysinimonas sp.]|uniref:bifunctional diguanylate cyclase/phosphodiesterase n=1 Tax=Pseudolysinimonas sp. TaxID=2680009 RepID=UPI003F7D7FAA